MANSDLTAKLELQAQAKGGEQIVKLGEELGKLADSTTLAGPQFDG